MTRKGLEGGAAPRSVGAAGSWKRQEGPPFRPPAPPNLQGSMALDTLTADSGLQDWERVSLCCFKPPDPDTWSFVMQPQGTDCSVSLRSGPLCHQPGHQPGHPRMFPQQ